MKVLLFQLDGSMPNIAMMRIAQHHHERGDDVELRWTKNVYPQLWDTGDEIVYASAIFQKTKPVVASLLKQFPGATVGGTGSGADVKLEDIGILTKVQDYSIYPEFRQSIGFTQRGCRLKCPFCVVPSKEGKVYEEQTVPELWRGDPHPRELILLDNDFFGQPNWHDRIREIREGGFKVSFSQGINCRTLTDYQAESIASVRYYDNKMNTKRIYTAWDNRRDEKRLFAGLELLVRHGVKPDHILVYMLCGYWDGETMDDALYRHRRLLEFGCRPYPMPYKRTKELIGFQRWAVRRIDRFIPWNEFKKMGYRLDNRAVIERAQL
jgi:hypothetical protein